MSQTPSLLVLDTVKLKEELAALITIAKELRPLVRDAPGAGADTYDADEWQSNAKELWRVEGLIDEIKNVLRGDEDAAEIVRLRAMREEKKRLDKEIQTLFKRDSELKRAIHAVEWELQLKKARKWQEAQALKQSSKS